MNLPPLAHRFLSDGSIEVICMNCFDVVCNVQVEEDATPFLDEHACESAELSNRRLPQRPALYTAPSPKGTAHFRILMPAFLRRHKGAA